MIIRIPFLPPSVNSCFYSDFKSHTRHKSAKYRKFEKDFMAFLPNWHVEGECEVEINLYFDTLRKNDIDNRIKPMLDTLVGCGIIEDDSKICRLVVEKYYQKGRPETAIEIKSMKSGMAETAKGN